MHKRRAQHRHSHGRLRGNPMLTTSLPPSSPPPSTSSQLQIVDHENLWGSDFDERGPVIDPLNVHATINSDPFGFFALENKLKLLKEQHPKSRGLQLKRKATGSSLPSSQTVLKTRSLLSSPSPSKPVATKHNGRALEQDMAEPGSAEECLEDLTRTVRGKSKQRHADNFRELSTSPPPKHARNRRRLPVRVQRRKEQENPIMAESSPKIKRPRKRNERTVKARAIDDNQLQKMAQERQARVDYFKKLEDYQLAKENVTPYLVFNSRLQFPGNSLQPVFFE
ncbi:hypothetical protein H0H93_016165 [Arthromyces matolae]|nr:hypothetical protein H0H93_016165 [Arthromyces matolae]